MPERPGGVGGAGGIEAPSGLAGLAVARTELSDVDGREGYCHYRGYDAVRLSETATVEEVWHLLREGELPSPEELEAFARRTREARALPSGLVEALSALAGPDEHLARLRSALSALGPLLGCRSWLDQPPAATAEQGMRIAALTPVLVAHLYRLGSGEAAVDPHPDLGYAANFLYMLEGVEPTRERVEALERYLVLTIDHGFSNSAFTARVIASSGADLAAAVSGAVGAFGGPMHGGAVGRVPTMLDAIGGVDRVEGWIAGALDRGERLMGFGHPVYETTDPRSVSLRRFLASRGGERFELAEAFERAAVRQLNERKVSRRREANVDFYAGIALEIAGVPEDLYTCTFAVARVIGWTSHVLEQVADNKIFRPAAHYVGPAYPRATD